MDIVAIHTLRDRGLIDFMMAVDDDLEINAKFRRTVIKDEVSRIEKMVRHLEDHGCTIPQRRVYATFPQFIAELFSALTKAEHTDWARGHIAKLRTEEAHRLVWENFERKKLAIYRDGCSHGPDVA